MPPLSKHAGGGPVTQHMPCLLPPHAYHPSPAAGSKGAVQTAQEYSVQNSPNATQATVVARHRLSELRATPAAMRRQSSKWTMPPQTRTEA